MDDDVALTTLMRAIGSADIVTASRLLDASPTLARARLGGGASRRVPTEFFITECRSQVYAGDTALHAAAFAHDSSFAGVLVGAGADVRAQNRRGAEPLHSATNGGPGSDHWDPERQTAVIRFLIGAGADPNAVAMGGVTPLHRAIRNRCSAAVRALLEAGADPNRRNDKGSTPLALAGWTTGRGGTGSTQAKAEQDIILSLLAAATG